MDAEVEAHFFTLVSMFPNVETEYIKEMCENPPFEESDEEQKLVMFINHLLSYEEKIDESDLNDIFIDDNQNNFFEELMEIQNDNIENNRNDLIENTIGIQDVQIENKSEIIQNILPDADPQMFKEFVKSHYDDPDSLNRFVESWLKNNNYTKRDKSFAIQKNEEKITRYTSGFSIKAFVEEFPEPFEHFDNCNRDCTEKIEALDFLKHRYHQCDDYILKNTYVGSKYNLSLTDNLLQKLYGQTLAGPYYKKVDNIPFLQEVAFIQNKESIKQYIDESKQKYEQELSKFRALKLLLECQCCYGEMKPNEAFECEDGHIFCRVCINKGTKSVLSDGKTSVACFTECTKEIKLSVLKTAVFPHIFEILVKKRQEAEILAANIDNLVICPFCPFSMDLAPEIIIFACKNPECMIVSCRACKKKNHLPYKCDEVLDSHKSRLLIEEEMSKTLIRVCYKCGRPFVKTHGCNAMTCICGAQMCYVCKEPMYNHMHMNNRIECTASFRNKMSDADQVALKKEEVTARIRKDFPDTVIPNVL